MELLWTEAAWKEYCNWQNQDKKTLKKLNEIIKDMQRNPCLQKSLLTQGLFSIEDAAHSSAT